MNTHVYIPFTLFALVHLWLFFRDRRLVAAKIASSIALVGFAALLAGSFPSWLGWPAAAPEAGVTYRVLAVDIREPSPDVPGRILAWLEAARPAVPANPFAHAPEASTPRAFALPFTPETEKAMQKAGKALREGHSVSAIFGEDGAPAAEAGEAGRAVAAGGAMPRGASRDGHPLGGNIGTAPRLLIDEPERILPAK
jgi:hypothetical protein